MPPLHMPPRIRQHVAVALLLVVLPLHLHAQTAATTLPSAEERAAELRATIARLSPGAGSELAEAHNALGLLHWSESRFDSALVHLRRAQSLWTAAADSFGMGRAFNNTGVTFYQAGHFEPALDAFSRSLALRQQIGDVRGVALVLSNIGTTYLDLRLYDRARPALEAGVEAADAHGHASVRGYAVHSLGLLHLHTGNYAEARRQFEASLAIYRTLDGALERPEAATGWGLNAVALGLLNVREGRNDEAIALLSEVLAVSEASGYARRQSTALLYLGRARRASGQLAQATRDLERSLAIATESSQRLTALEALEELAAVHEARGDTHAALASLRAHGMLRDSIFSQTTLQRIAEMESRDEAQQQEAENVRLRSERQARDAVIARQRVAGLLGGALLAVSLLLVGALVHYNRTGRARQRQLAEANSALEGSNAELRVALSEVRTLKGFIPICASCKKVRDDRGFWESVESYISSRSEALFSHGICNDCGPRLYGIDWPDPAPGPVPHPASDPIPGREAAPRPGPGSIPPRERVASDGSAADD
jgi:tetratricopeptide (TPR) repeat protein